MPYYILKVKQDNLNPFTVIIHFFVMKENLIIVFSFDYKLQLKINYNLITVFHVAFRCAASHK